MNCNDVTVFPHWSNWSVYGESFPNGREITDDDS